MAGYLTHKKQKGEQDNARPQRQYETFADCSDKEDSFGFSAWAKEKYAKHHYGELVVPCKVYYGDVARGIDKGGPSRCGKLTVLA